MGMLEKLVGQVEELELNSLDFSSDPSQHPEDFVQMEEQ